MNKISIYPLRAGEETITLFVDNNDFAFEVALTPEQVRQLRKDLKAELDAQKRMAF